MFDFIASWHLWNFFIYFEKSLFYCDTNISSSNIQNIINVTKMENWHLINKDWRQGVLWNIRAWFAWG